MHVLRGRLVQVQRLPREAVAERPPVDAEMLGKLGLTGVPLAALHELDDADRPPSSPAPAHDAEGRRGLPLPVTGVDEDDRLGTCHAAEATVSPAEQGTPCESGAVPQL